jgi:hypothetical protein
MPKGEREVRVRGRVELERARDQDFDVSYYIIFGVSSWICTFVV